MGGTYLFLQTINLTELFHLSDREQTAFDGISLFGEEGEAAVEGFELAL